MIEIIDNGIYKKKFIHKCDTCKCKFTYLKIDTQRGEFNVATHQYAYWVTCPECCTFQHIRFIEYKGEIE